MKKLAITVLLAAAGCTRQVAVSSPPGVASNVPGATTPREAVTRFMASAKVQDLQAMSNIWGGPKGPARETMDKEALEMREVIMMRCLKHDTFAIVSEGGAAEDRVLAVDLKLRNLTARTDFTTTRGPKNRWYVKVFAMEPLKSICTAK